MKLVHEQVIKIHEDKRIDTKNHKEVPTLFGWDPVQYELAAIIVDGEKKLALGPVYNAEPLA